MGGWAHPLQIGGILFVLFVVALLLWHGLRLGSWPRRRNRFRRGVLPAPRGECRRPGVEAVP